jgi:hypothetical protein
MNRLKLLLLVVVLAAGAVFSAVTGLHPLLAVGAMAVFGQGAMPPNALAAVTSIGDILWGDGDDNMGGIRTIAHIALHSDVASGGHRAPATRAAATNLEELATINTDLGFKEGKGWKQVYCTEDKGLVESAIQGERDGKSWLTRTQLFHPGNKARIVGFMRLVQNAGLYAHVWDAEGLGRLIGSEFYPAKVNTATITTTETAAGLKGVTFEVYCNSPYPAPICTFEPALEGSGS